jgi:hypothetical protein
LRKRASNVHAELMKRIVPHSIRKTKKKVKEAPIVATSPSERQTEESRCTDRKKRGWRLGVLEGVNCIVCNWRQVSVSSYMY